MGHGARVDRIETELRQFPSIALAGSAYHGVGIADCVRTGEDAAEKIVTFLKPKAEETVLLDDRMKAGL